MSIKDLFDNSGTPKIQKSVTSDELVETVESSDFVEAKKEEHQQFVPPIDFSDPANFAKFGSAELYYEKAFERIHNYYPYDGTLAEKVEFENSSSYLDKYVFENLYPRTNGHVTFDGTQYIDVYGGPHTASVGMAGKPLENTFDSSVVYDEDKGRTSAFEYRGSEGITIEFWMKKDSIPNVRECILEIWNEDQATSPSLELSFFRSPNRFRLWINSATVTASRIDILSDIELSSWNHYAIVISNGDTETQIETFVNGEFNSTTPYTGKLFEDILPSSSGMNLRIGKRISTSSQPSLFEGSIDEFRFWKTKRTPEQIYNSWFTQVGGGTNKNDANLDLGLYFKFNEGITGNDSLDEIVLDYSGRINNGYVTSYSSAFRNTGSAITEKLGEPEFLDPIIYSSHPDVISEKAEYKASGSIADRESTSQIISYFPAWMQEEDEQSGKQLRYLSQVIGSYFDTMWHQVNFVNRIHDQHFISGSNKALPFSKKLLYDRGFVMPDLFVDATITENLLNKDENEVYEKEINEVRNTIYHNIYNNLDTIYKSKGTEKSFRNFFRSVGIGQDLVKLNMYADDSTFVLRDNYQFKSLEKNFVNFNRNGHFDATLFQSSSNGDYYIPGDKDYLGSFTVETELVLPRKQRKNEVNYLPFNHLTASISGFHSTGSAFDFPTTDLGMSAYVLKNTEEINLNDSEDQTVRFMVTGAFGELISDEFQYQYDNNKWNLAVRMKHSTYPYANITGSVDDEYTVEFYGVEADGNTKRNSFYLTSSAVSADYFRSDKIFYAGAERTNYSGSVIYNTDIRLGGVRYWHSYLSNEAIDQHGYDPETFGANNPQQSDLVDTYDVEIPREKTLALHWGFNTLTGSDSSGEMIIPDLSSGSASPDRYGSLADTLGQINEAKGIEFNTSDSKAIDKDFLHVARKRLADNLMSSDLTTIKTDETEQFFVDDDVSDNFYAFEKSMYGVISDEMMNMFSTALDLNNLIGQPNQKYHHRYNLMDFLRDRFYDDVENEPDIEKFTSFYKWIDDSISTALQQLIPASARFSEKINNIIESHALERSKYIHQVPILTTFESTEGSIKGITEMKYDWKHGHAPTYPEEEQINALWQRERKEKEGLRETLRQNRNNHSLQSSGLIRKEIDGSTRVSDTYAVRRFSKTYDVSIVSQPTLHGGTNFSRNKNIHLFNESVQPAGEENGSGEPTNIVTVGLGDGDGLIEQTRNDDNPPRKRKFEANANIQKFGNDEYAKNLKSNFVLPMNLMSGTVHTGYNKEVKEMFSSDVIFSNLHHDIVGRTNDTPMQGPFTETHVGGLQYRHIDVNQYDINKTLTVDVETISTPPTGTVEFDIAVLNTKYNEGTGSWVRLRDADGTRTTFYYAPFYDIVDGQWSTIDELSYLISYRLDIEVNKQSNSILEVTQSTSGSFYNSTITTDSNNFITASGFAGGLPPTIVSINRNLDGRGQRPEGWGLLFKTHIREDEEDGAFGFVGADYGTPYPYPYYAKATRYREEHAKRPINVKNIKTLSGSQKVGNYKNEIDLFSVAPQYQKTWAKRAYEDPNVEILPTFISNDLPDTTNYQTLIGVAPYASGNVFGVGAQGNRQPDVASEVSNTYAQADLNIDFDLTRTPLNNAGGIYRIERANYVANSGVDETRAILIRWSNGDPNGTILRTTDTIRISVNFSPMNWASTLANLQTTINNHADIGALIQIPTYEASSGRLPIQIAGLLGTDGNGGSFSPTLYANHFDSYETTFTGGSTTTITASSNINVIEIPSTASQYISERNINTRFSAPGGPEVQSIGYLDAYSQTYSAYSAITFRNLTVLHDSGEDGTIRVEDHLGLRRGLNTLRALHMGKFGIDPDYGQITSADYPTSGSYTKQHRNTSNRMEWSSSTDVGNSGPELITGSAYDNSFINTPIPRSELQYSWIANATSGSDAPSQNILGYAPRDGIVSSSVGFVEAIIFPSASSIIGS